MINFRFLFFSFIFFFIFYPFSKVVAVAAAVTPGEGYCICATNCIPFSYNNEAELKNANTACGAKPCSSLYTFKQNAKCDVPSPVHCDCKSGCVNKTYTNTQVSLQVVEDFCKGTECGSKDESKKGACPESSASSGGGTSGKKEPDIVSLKNPLGLGKTVPAILGAIIKGALGIMGGLVLLMVVWGGVTWITAAGSPEKIKAGSQTILWALLGAIVTVASYMILNYIMKQFF